MKKLTSNTDAELVKPVRTPGKTNQQPFVYGSPLFARSLDTLARGEPCSDTSQSTEGKRKQNENVSAARRNGINTLGTMQRD